MYEKIIFEKTAINELTDWKGLNKNKNLKN